MSAALATFALPAAALATWALIRSPLGRRVVAEPRGDRWHERQTPLLGGIGLFAGLLVGVGAALAADALEPSKELFGILGGCAIVFAAGLADDLRALPPAAKLASQVGAVALAVGLACAGFLPFNLRPGKPAAIFMGDSGSQLLGFALAALGLSASWKAAGTTVAALFLPILVLAVPILDTTLVTIVRILLTFALLVQFATFLSDLQRAPAGRMALVAIHTRRLVEVLVDFAIVGAAFFASYLLFVHGTGSTYQKHIFVVTLPVLLAARFVFFILFGLYRGVWRYAGAREATATIAAVGLSELFAYVFFPPPQP